MATRRQEKVERLIREGASQFLRQHSPKDTLITVTNTSVSENFERSTIFVTVFPEKREESTMNHVRKKLGQLRDFMRNKLIMKTLPYFEIKIDEGEKNRQRIDELSKKT